jgi:hypothetical protein
MCKDKSKAPVKASLQLLYMYVSLNPYMSTVLFKNEFLNMSMAASEKMPGVKNELWYMYKVLNKNLYASEYTYLSTFGATTLS